MINSVVKQSIDLRLKFETPPRLTASSEICVLCGMLCRICDIPLPDKIDTTGQLKDFTLSNIHTNDSKVNKMVMLLSTCQKESESITDEWLELMKYGYNNA